MRVCIIYDCLYPYTVGGAERWYRNLAAELVAAGHDVTYLTRRQWPAGAEPDLGRVRVIAVAPGGPLYTEDGRRRIGPPLRFGLGVFAHLARQRRAYDVVHCCSFPFFSLLAARLALTRTRVLVAVDWLEVWTTAYWRTYVGAIRGRIGHLVQRLCVRLSPLAFVFSRLHSQRLTQEGLPGSPILLAGLYAGSAEPLPEKEEREHLVVFAGRHIREKRIDLLPGAIAAARARVPDLRGLILGDGPEHQRVLSLIAAQELQDVIEAPGFVEAEAVARAFGRASCLVLPSEREGYGLVVIEAAAAGTPTVLAPGPDNAAVELVSDGVNGFVARTADEVGLAEAIVRVIESGAGLRRRTGDWFASHGAGLTAAASARVVEQYYRSARS